MPIHRTAAFGLCALLCAESGLAAALRFYGYGRDDIDRVKFLIADTDTDPTTAPPGPPLDVGAGDFTVEFWLRTDAPGPAITDCASNYWIEGRIVVDRDRHSQGRAWGVSLTEGRIAFGVDGENDQAHTLCSITAIADDRWHHVAVQRRRSDGWMEIWVDGVREAAGDGPDGDVSYPDDGVPESRCAGAPCTGSDPYLVLGAEKHDAGPAYPSYRGDFDELRVSTVLRYRDAFQPARVPFSPDADTAGLYHFDEGAGDIAHDCMGRTDGVLRRGPGSPGPEWIADSPFTGAADPCPASGAGSTSSSSASSGSTSSSSDPPGSSVSSSSRASGTAGSSSSAAGGAVGPTPASGGGGATGIFLVVLLTLRSLSRSRRRDSAPPP